MSFDLQPMMISGKEVLPLIEGGKGVAISTGESSGAWAAAGCIGTFSAVNADSIDEHGQVIRTVYHGRSRLERFDELVAQGIKGGIQQARIAHDISGGNGRLHMNVLWEMGGAERVLEGVMEGAKGLIHGITCGAGMPFRLASWRPNTMSIIIRLFHPHAHLGHYGCVLIASNPICSAAWYMKTHGWPAVITACPIPKALMCRKIPIPAWRRCVKP